MTAPAGTDRELASLLGTQAGRSSTGILTAVRGKLKRLFCIERGRLVFAASNVIEEQFIERLVRNGIASPAERATATRAAKEGTAGLLPALIEVAGIDSERVAAELREHVLYLIDTTLVWPDGQYRFDEGKPKLDGEMRVSIPLVEVLLQHARRHPASVEQTLVRIGPPDTRPERSPAAERILTDVPVDETVRWLLANADGTRVVTELAEAAPGENGPATRAIYGLVLSGALRRSGEPAKEENESLLETLTRDQVLGWLSRAEGADHYTVLGLDPSTDRDAIRRAYYQLARRMHPDRFRTGENSDLLERVERFFTRVTEAYNTLFDPERRKEYDRLAGETAERQREETAKTDPTYLARQNFLRARALVERRRYTEAVSFLENAIRLDEGHAEYHLELGRLLSRNPRMRPEAERRLRRAAEIDPSLVETYLALGELYERMQRKNEAAAAYREALRWEPEHEEAGGRLRSLGG